MADLSSDTHIFSLGRMPQQASVREARDDWTGVINRKERRKLQNRLNQRRFRSRKQDNGAKPQSAIINGEKQADAVNNHEDDGDNSLSLTVARSDVLPAPIICRLSEAQHSRCTFAPAAVHALMVDFERGAMKSLVSGSPKTDLLIKLSRVNVLRAAYENAFAMGMSAEWVCEDDRLSIFNLPGPCLSEDSIPSSLRPTPTQRKVPHHPWLDIFPFPRMRDNFIRAGDNLNDDDLCHDLTAFWDTHRSDANLLVWGAPWDPQNWEATEEFARKWGFFLQGCPEILISTNNWRKRRGEKPLVWKRIFGIF
ncbi:unnamed protein product [Penicillium salamii]|uniref:BZIP domain-containing protein n=1 Tax=Penicillium salamii TaxID=1612424 RepID=A0A9W4JPF0_9EURO|nr:unnamed protein product [Penicillium salamii]CAG8133664.1 unnamed protein product [Penicillium salamii]CAG8156392.1 unnamed protein product [Penicillium salamii]CAG8233043.1 unnamed protein product [Penicillium salamii]CAG8233185.1 unnamed protein product [Penicillium salamii]